MRSILLSIAAAVMLLAPVGAPALVFAAGNPIIPVCNAGNNTGTDASNTDVCKDLNAQETTQDPIIKIIKAAVEIVSYITGAAAVILIVISGIRFVTSGGDSNNVAQAKSTLAYALVGVAITVAARVIIAFVLDHVK